MSKNKVLKYGIVVFIIIAAIISMILIINGQSKAEDRKTVEFAEHQSELSGEAVAGQEKALEAHELLCKTMNIYNVGVFPEDFGGDYIEEEKLIICVTEESAIQRYQKVLGDNPAVEFRIVKRSYKEIQQMIKEFYDKYKYEYELYSYYVDVKNNRGVITTLGNDINDIEKLLFGTGIDIVHGDEVIPQ